MHVCILLALAQAWQQANEDYLRTSHGWEKVMEAKAAFWEAIGGQIPHG